MVKSILAFFREVFFKAMKGVYFADGFTYSGAITFTSLFALIPTFAILAHLFALSGYFHSFSMGLFEEFAKFLPDYTQKFLDIYRQLIKNALSLSILNILVVSYSILSLIIGIGHIFDKITDEHSTATFRQTALKNVLMFILFFFTFFTLVVLNKVVIILIIKYMPELRFLLSFTTLFLQLGFFTLLYIYLPTKKIWYVSSVFGSIVLVLLINFVLPKLFYLIVIKLSSVNLIYGSFFALPVFLMYLYSIWTLVIFSYALANAFDVEVSKIISSHSTTDQ